MRKLPGGAVRWKGGVHERGRAAAAQAGTLADAREVGSWRETASLLYGLWAGPDWYERVAGIGKGSRLRDVCEVVGRRDESTACEADYGTFRLF